jgi:hypothetical protein
MSNRDEAIIVVHDWLTNGIPQVNSAKKQNKPKSIAVELTIVELLSGLKNVDLDRHDVIRIEKILMEKGLVSSIVLKDSLSSELFGDYLVRLGITTVPLMWKKNFHIR